MKLLFASDIHGSATATETLLSVFEKEKAERLIILGDFLYHGPRNPLPDGYAPAEVIRLLNNFTPTPLCVRGNCDAEVDQMVLSFPIMADYALLPLDNKRTAFITHGHLFSLDNPPPHKEGDILIHGHTHVHCSIAKGGLHYLNPGSISLPKENQVPSYMIYENGCFQIKDLHSGDVLVQYDI